MEQYIPKSAVLAEINRVLNSYDPNEITSGRYALVDLRNFIDTLEVKEVDLDEEINDWYNTEASEEFEYVLYRDIENCAKHFYELGLKAQKGE